MISDNSFLEDSLRRSHWAQSLSAEQMARVEQDVVEKVIAPGGYVCRKGEPADHWIGVVDGLLKLSSVSPEGKIVTLSAMPSGSWFGEGSMLKTEDRRYDIIALRASRVAMVPRTTFEWLLDNSIPFNRFLLLQLNERLGLFISMVEFDRMLDTDARVARCLASLFNPYLNPGIALTLQISQEEIGYLCSTSRQRANQALQVLERAGLLRVDYGSITILDLDRLRVFDA
jgi:CRP-like cAMP-binding protein